MILPEVRDKIQNLPLTPGVYLMKGEAGAVLYVGKALSLRKRGRNYLNPGPDMPKLCALMNRVRDVEYIETPTEVDALLLEAQLIRKYKPHYNVELKDDKTFPLLKITADLYPRLHITRNKSDKKAIYYGPYTDSKLLREAVNLIHALFPIRKCRRLPKKACLYYHIGQCLAPCIKPDIKEEYGYMVQEVRAFLGGGKKSFVEYLSDRMQEAAMELRFEDAQFYKDQLEALRRLRKKRFSTRTGEAAVALSATLELKKMLRMEKLPEKIVCFDVSNIHGDEAVASRVSFHRELPDKMGYRRYKIKSVEGINDYAMIQEALGRMLAGIKEGRETFIPDVIMIDGGKGHWNAAREVILREGFESVKLISIAKRFETIYGSRLEESGNPDSAGENSQKIKPLDLAFPSDSPALYLLQKIRDEAHRFAITYHRSLKLKQIQLSELDRIPGIGESRKKILLESFDSLDELKRAGAEQIAGLPGMNQDAALRVWNYFHLSSVL